MSSLPSSNSKLNETAKKAKEEDEKRQERTEREENGVTTLKSNLTGSESYPR